MPRNPLPVNPPAIVREEKQLASLAAKINGHQDAADEGARVSLEESRRAGDALLQAKEECVRAQRPWLKWLGENVKRHAVRCREDMRIAANWDLICSVSTDSVDMGRERALSLIAESRQEEEEESAAASGSDEETAPADEDKGADSYGEEQDVPKRDLFPMPMSGPTEPPGKLVGYITLDRWEGMSAAARKRALRPPPSNTTFNAQNDNEGIEWAKWSWNTVTGCLHNCPYCYARDIANRFYEQKFVPSFWPERLHAPQNTHFPEDKAAAWVGWKNVFVCSMADLFGRWVPSEWIEAVLDAVRNAPRWNFLFLTKFPIRMAEFDFPENAWVGTTVDCQARVANAEKAFRKVKAGVKWLSCEPLIEPLKFKDLGAFDWVVIGGASASSQTPEWRVPLRWVLDLADAADKAGCQVYQKPNGRIQEYPGVEPQQEAPKELRYLPEVADKP